MGELIASRIFRSGFTCIQPKILVLFCRCENESIFLFKAKKNCCRYDERPQRDARKHFLRTKNFCRLTVICKFLQVRKKLGNNFFSTVFLLFFLLWVEWHESFFDTKAFLTRKLFWHKNFFDTNTFFWSLSFWQPEKKL